MKKSRKGWWRHKGASDQKRPGGKSKFYRNNVQDFPAKKHVRKKK